MECFGRNKRMERQCADDVIIYIFQLKVFYIVRKCNQPNYTDTHTLQTNYITKYTSENSEEFCNDLILMAFHWRLSMFIRSFPHFYRHIHCYFYLVRIAFMFSRLKIKNFCLGQNTKSTANSFEFSFV